jgi:hypothetical protein
LLPQNFVHINCRWPELLQKLFSVDLPDQLEHVYFGGVQTLVVNGIQLCSRYAPQHEARLQASLIPAGHEAVYVYGLANGDLIRELLARDEVIHLHLILLNTAIDRANFGFFDHSDWLVDSRVNILNAATEGELPVLLHFSILQTMNHLDCGIFSAWISVPPTFGNTTAAKSRKFSVRCMKMKPSLPKMEMLLIFLMATFLISSLLPLQVRLCSINWAG